MSECVASALERLRTCWSQRACSVSPCWPRTVRAWWSLQRAVMAAFAGVWTQEFWRCVAAEFLAMLLFVLLSLGSTVNWGSATAAEQQLDLVLVSLCFGLGIATMVQCFGHVSGAHLNPAVTAAMVVTRKLSLAKGVFYLLAQCLGAVAGSAVLYGVTPPAVRGGMGVTTVNSSISAGNALVVELFITFQLVLTVFATCDARRGDLKGSAALAIGLSVSVGHMFAIPYTGASMNPARSLGPAVVTWSWDNHWVYWVGPVLGGVLAAATYEYLFCPDPELKKAFDAFANKKKTKKNPFNSSSSSSSSHAGYREVLRRSSVAVAKEPLFTVMEDAERAERMMEECQRGREETPQPGDELTHSSV